MSIKVAFQMDLISNINFKSDSTVMLMLEALRRGLDIYYYYPKQLYLENGIVKALVSKVSKIQELAEVPISLETAVTMNLATFDIIWLRQDPPFDMAYITSTFLLEKLLPEVLVLNNPFFVRNSPEKIIVTYFHKFMPPTLITQNEQLIHNFVNKYQDCVIKPLYGNAGTAVFFLSKSDKNYNVIIETFLNTYTEAIMVQKFIPNVTKGDKRIILIEGEPYGVLNRVPSKNEIRSNLAVGGIGEIGALSDKDKLICADIATTLKDQDLFFVGIDVIDGYLTEINVTSPTGLRSILNISGENLAVTIWDKILQKLS